MTTQEILSEIESIFDTKWKARDGRTVPDTDSVTLGNDAIKLEGTVLYADLADSTQLVDGYKDWFAAEIYKAYLVAGCRAIKNQDGDVTAFDGDRVMAVFTGEMKNTHAAKAALHINYLVSEINKMLAKHYPNSSYRLRHAIGIDSSSLYIAKTGVRAANDLVWVGRAANYAAKLCALGDSTYPTYITETVYNKLHDDAKYGGQPKTNMWEKRIWTDKGVAVYRSSWTWAI
jgi:class 3 adenylate cyclase